MFSEGNVKKRADVIEGVMEALSILHDQSVDLGDYRASLFKAVSNAAVELQRAPVALPSYSELSESDGRTWAEIFADYKSIRANREATSK